MTNEKDLAQGIETHPVTAALQDMVLESEDVQEFLTGLATIAAESVSGAYREVLCDVTLLRRRSIITVASSSDRAREVDEVQYGFDDGPCLRAAREGVTLHIRDFLTESRFPE